MQLNKFRAGKGHFKTGQLWKWKSTSGEVFMVVGFFDAFPQAPNTYKLVFVLDNHHVAKIDPGLLRLSAELLEDVP